MRPRDLFKSLRVPGGRWGSWSPNSTVLHLDIYLCKYTNLKTQQGNLLPRPLILRVQKSLWRSCRGSWKLETSHPDCQLAPRLLPTGRQSTFSLSRSLRKYKPICEYKYACWSSCPLHSPEFVLNIFTGWLRTPILSRISRLIEFCSIFWIC